MILLFTFSISWLSAILGLLASSVEAVQWISFLVIFPLTFASAAFAPTDTMVPALKFFAENQPVTHMVETLRSLMIGTPMGNHAIIAIVWWVGVMIVAMPIATYLFRRYSGR
jgi:ABC-2 type transport system permease protein